METWDETLTREEKRFGEIGGEVLKTGVECLMEKVMQSNGVWELYERISGDQFECPVIDFR